MHGGEDLPLVKETDQPYFRDAATPDHFLLKLGCTAVVDDQESSQWHDHDGWRFASPAPGQKSRLLEYQVKIA